MSYNLEQAMIAAAQVREHHIDAGTKYCKKCGQSSHQIVRQNITSCAGGWGTNVSAISHIVRRKDPLEQAIFCGS